MIKLTKISVSKLQDSGEVDSKKPSHALNVSDEKYENKVVAGKFWTKTGNYGKFLSGELSKSRTHEGKDYDGYVIITEKEWNEYQTLKSDTQGVKVSSFDPSKGEVNVDEIDF